MRQLIRRLSDRTEFVVVAAISFSWVILSSLLVLLSGVRRFELNAASVVRSILIEVLILAVVIAILRARGWTMRRLGLEFSWKAAAAGIPLFVIYLLVYAITTTLVLMLYPAASTAWVFSFINRAPFALVLLFIILNSVFEELLVTAYVIESFARDGAGLAITVSTLLRFAYHLYQGPLASLSIIPLGLLFATMYWRWRNVWPLMVAHTLSNVVVFALNPERAA